MPRPPPPPAATEAAAAARFRRATSAPPCARRRRAASSLFVSNCSTTFCSCPIGRRRRRARGGPPWKPPGPAGGPGPPGPWRPGRAAGRRRYQRPDQDDRHEQHAPCAMVTPVAQHRRRLSTCPSVCSGIVRRQLFSRPANPCARATRPARRRAGSVPSPARPPLSSFRSAARYDSSIASPCFAVPIEISGARPDTRRRPVPATRARRGRARAGRSAGTGRGGRQPRRLPRRITNAAKPTTPIPLTASTGCPAPTAIPTATAKIT